MNKLYALLLGVCVTVAMVPARAQVSTNPNNTIVRFDFSTGGTNVGNVDIELFDEDKPETVKNFMLYVYSGMYSNLLVHRLATNPPSATNIAVLQAGHVRLEEPASSDAFEGYIPGRNLGRITNEFNVGPVLSNTFGTIAMARVGGITNSASTDWFFNLEDNSYLDTNYGGFTVFGRVINTTAPNNGTNLLRFFATWTNLTYAFFVEGESFGQLPFSNFNIRISTNDVVSTNVTYTTNEAVIVTNTVVVTNTVIATNILSVRYKDLYTINASVLRGGITPEKKKPQVKLASSSKRIRETTNATVNLSGTAQDDTDVVRVVYEANSATEIVNGTTTWAGDIPLRPGTNTFQIRSIDQFGNESKTVTHRIFYKVPTPITLSNYGPGFIMGATNQQLLDLGRNYTLLAKPDRGNFFMGWSGTFSNFSSQIAFQMRTGLVLNAVFTTNPFPRLRGTYFGVMAPYTASSGYRVGGTISLKLGPKGIYNGRIQTLGSTYPMRGFFNLANQSAISGTVGSKTLSLVLTIYTNGPARMTGFYGHGDEVAVVEMHRLENLDTPVPQAGDYTFVIAPELSSAVGEGFGVGTAQVSEDGDVTVSGTLQNGAEFSQSTTLHAGGFFPLVSKWNSREALLGWVGIATNNNSLFGGLRWLSETFTNAFGEGGGVTGSRFVPPAEGAQVLSWTNGSAQLDGGDIEPAIEVPVTLQGSRLVVGTNDIDLQFTNDNVGNITGTFLHPASQAVTPIRGVFLQESNVAAGFFPGTNRSGVFRLRAAP